MLRMIRIRRALSPAKVDAMMDMLHGTDRSAVVFNGLSDALVGFSLEWRDDKKAAPIYDNDLMVNTVARRIQSESGCYDDEALVEAEASLSGCDFSPTTATQEHPSPIFCDLAFGLRSLTFDEYQANAELTMQKSDDPNMLANFALGLAGEAGEVIELVKKHLYHGKDLDKSALTKELGDLLWYVSAVCTQVGIELDDVADQNLTKLSARYPNGFVKGGGNR